MLDQNDTEYYDVGGMHTPCFLVLRRLLAYTYCLVGALMYDPCIGAFDAQNDIYILPFIEQNNNVLGYNDSFIEHLSGLDEDCGWAKCEYKDDNGPNGVKAAQNIR